MTDWQAKTIATAPDELADVLRAWMQATQRLQATHETLQGEIERLRAELRSKDRELERRRRLACLGELAAGVAHEVRNPLGAIRLYAGLLRGECSGQERALALIEKMEAGIRAIDGVVQDTLALAPRGGMHGGCRLQAVIEGAADLAQRTLAQRGCVLKLRGALDAAQVRGDLPGLQRVLLNLIINAAEASPPGEAVELEFEVVPGIAAGADARPGDDAPRAVRLRVLDRGAGLPDEILERIFDPFFTTKETGTGLGLTIAHRVIDAYGGRLSARNRPDGGAEFELVLPMMDLQEDTRGLDGPRIAAA